MFTKTLFLKRLSMLAFLLMGVLACVFYSITDISVIDLSSGFSHPLDGWDHIVTMLGVGIWAAQLRGKAIWLLPTTFVGVMSLGAISGAAKYLVVPSAEILILLSCLVFSVLIIRKIRFDTKINVLIVAFFAFFHGYAHGQEISTSASLISYTLGFMIATLLLHGAGILVAKVVLLSATFFIAQLLSSPPPVETAKNTAVNIEIRHTNTFEQYENQHTLVQKPPLINYSPQWLNLSPPLNKPILLFFTPLKTYFVLCALLLVFSISQFVCYVFYIKQRRNFVFCSKSLAHSLFQLSLYLLTLLAFQLSTFIYSRYLSFQKAGFCASKIFYFRKPFSEILMKIHSFKKLCPLFGLAILLAPEFAHAHSMAFTVIDWNSGFFHPLQGFDHILAMLAVGFWAAQLRGKAVWLLPLTFVSVMSLGGLFGTANIEVPYAEAIILSSGFVLSVLAIRKVQFDLKIMALIFGFFALFHGFAHGAEIANSANFLSYSLGFIAATSLLHLMGIGIAYLIRLLNLEKQTQF